VGVLAVYQVLEEPQEWFSLAAPNEGLAMGRECCNVARRPPETVLPVRDAEAYNGVEMTITDAAIGS
jgi:hypothetical protein